MMIRLMYGCGDAETPLRSSAQVLESLVVDYVTDLCHHAKQSAAPGGPVTPMDFFFALRKDPPKYRRAMQMIENHRKINAAKRGATTGKDGLEAAEEAAEAGVKQKGLRARGGTRKKQ